MPLAGTFTVGAAIANNSVNDTVEAYSDGSTISSAGQITISAVMPATAMIQATSVAASVAISRRAVRRGLLRRGRQLHEYGGQHDRQLYRGRFHQHQSKITATGNITLTAAENATITSEVGAVAAAGAVDWRCRSASPRPTNTVDQQHHRLRR